jgi:hypothetical protein
MRLCAATIARINMLQESVNSQTPRQLLRPAQAMNRLGCKHSKFRLICKSGALDVRKLGRATVITEESLLAFIRSLPTLPKGA